MVVLTAVVQPPALAAPADRSDPAGSSGVTDPAGLVDPFMGTGTGPAFSGAVGTFPGADVPFGMLQWSPDTSPDRIEGGGYDYADDAISGFSLTHLSGAGCPIFGDVPILPSVGAIPSDPANLTEPFSHGQEQASPGQYQVTLGSPPVTVHLAATTRTGIGQFTFPSTDAAHLLFNVDGSETGVIASSVQTHGSDEVTGSVTSGNFCGSWSAYTLHFVAVFNHPFVSTGTWTNGGLEPGTRSCAGTSTQACGAWVTFDAAAGSPVTMKVAISYVSGVNATANLAAEDPGWSLQRVEARATAQWNAALGRIAIEGGDLPAERTFYTSLYHSLLDPSIFSDDNGQYMGLDGRVHATHGRVQYANFSEWDVYRSEIPLLSMLDPGRVSDMMQSLVDDAEQTGWLPTWELASSNTGEMNGDSADPIIADAYAFGIRGFDSQKAFAAMLKGATDAGTEPGGIYERQGLANYTAQGFVPDDEVGVTQGVTMGGSATLEYALDDFSIAQVAADLGHESDYRMLMRRAQNWQVLFNPATGYIQARQADGSFPAGPALQTYNALLQSEGVTQEGFQEGNAIQYTWSVPQNLEQLFAAMGGSAAATAKLDAFFTQLNAGPFVAQDWSGNEPDLWAPWEYDYSGAPWRTQEVVRQIADTQYSATPAGEPGNDDLGAMASWYVWAALGLYPLTPGTANLVLSSPLFPRATIHLAGGKTLVVRARGAPDVYIHATSVATGSGPSQSWTRPWLPAGILRSGGTVSDTLGTAPDPTWGASPGSSPPSYSTQSAPAIGYTTPSGAVQAQPGVATTVTFGAQSVVRHPVTIEWTASAPSGTTVTPSSGRFSLPASRPGAPYPRRSTTVRLVTSTAGAGLVHFSLTLPGRSASVPPVALEVNPPL